mgnify:CR=1 FL=1
MGIALTDDHRELATPTGVALMVALAARSVRMSRKLPCQMPKPGSP